MKTNISVLLALFTTSFLFAQDIVVAPANPAFVEWQSRAKARRATVQTSEATEQVESFGYIPSPVNRSHLTNGVQNVTTDGSAPIIRKAATLPSKYDCREECLVTSVKNQSPYGTCWTFAAMASLEGYILKNEGNIRDFSENNLANLNGFNFGYDGGGNDDMAIAYFTRGDGPVAEAYDPYSSVGTSTNQTPIRFVHRVIEIPAKTDYLDHDGIKQALLDYGPLAVGYYHDSSCLSYENYSYYSTGYTYSNHAVTLVGWDDDYPAENFINTPAGDGAYIIKNSWGPNWGDEGYMYISYYDEVLCFEPLYSYHSKKMHTLGRIYDYTPYGNVLKFGFNYYTNAQMANMFTAEATEMLGAASFFAAVPNTTYTLKVYVNCTTGNPTSGTCAYTKSGTVPFAGYETIFFDKLVSVTKGSIFSIFIEINTPNFTSPIVLEANYYPYYLDSAECERNQSFYKHPKQNYWSDLYDYYGLYGGNICIKAFAIDATQESEVPVPYSWLDNYPTLLTANGNDYETAAKATAVNGLSVSDCYIAGIDPTASAARFEADISFTNSVPSISWNPTWNYEGYKEGIRWYTIYGKKKLDDTSWEEVQSGKEAGYNFFKVGVELP